MTALLFGAVPADARLDADIARVARSAKSDSTFVSVGNGCQSVQESKVSVRVGATGIQPRTYVVAFRRQGERIVLRGPDVSSNADVYAYARVSSERCRHSALAVSRARLPRSSRAANSNIAGTAALTGGLSLFGVIVGIWLTHVVTRRRERDQATEAWRRELFIKQEPAYRNFQANWGGSHVDEVLRSAAQRLRSEALLPSSVDAELRAAEDTLRAGSEAEKTAAVERLQRILDDFVADPWSRVGNGRDARNL